MSGTAFFTVVYPGVEPWLPDFFRSLEAQTDTDFELVVVNDGLQDLHRFTAGAPYSVRVLDAPAATPLGNRQAGIDFLVQHYEMAIFGDADDAFAPNRVSTCKDLLATYDLVVNDFDLTGTSGETLKPAYLSQRLPEGYEFNFNFLLDKNIAGLTNTAVHLKRAGGSVVLPEGIIAADWYFFSLLLYRGLHGVFTAATRSYYRQHPKSLIGLGSIDAERVAFSVKVKEKHYAALGAALPEWTHFCKEAGRKLDALQQLPEALAAFREKVLQDYRGDEFWWEYIQIT